MKRMFEKMAMATALSVCMMYGAFAQSSVSVEMEPGKNWKTTMWMFIIPVAKAPQVASWIETPSGEYVTTLLVTNRASRKNWIGSPVDGRPESLPVWYYASGKLASDAGIDAATSATPVGKDPVVGTTAALVPGQEYIAFVEINHSFDYNDTWVKKGKPGDAGYSGVNGQPSVVYRARFIAGTAGQIPLEFAGQGSVTGADGKIVPGTAGLTTALSIIRNASVKVQ